MYKPVDELINKIDNLENNTQPEWGTMTAQKMVEHLANTFKIANGKLEVECFSEEKKLPVLRKVLMSDRPMPKGFKSPANELLPQDYEYESFESAKEALKKEVDDYYKFFNENPESKLVNPTFGELNKEEWEQFHRKHLKHHLTQFGLIP